MSTAIFSQGMKHRYRFSRRSWYSALGMVDLVLQIHDLDHRFRHPGLGAVGVARHPRKGGRGMGGQIIESRDLLDFGVDPGVQKPGLG